VVNVSGYRSRGPGSIFWEVGGPERGPLILASTVEGLLERNSSGSGLESDITAVGIRRADHATPPLYP
jgi:hypothetical protein